ncbi:cyclic-nucleotide gated cation channel [Aphelenchoides avenae]|nr:cyclic-nucleotide gated cation channel [Aphelenchus avenae]
MMCVIFVYDDTQGVFLYYWIAGNVFFDMVFVFDIIVNAKLTYMEDGLTVRQWRRLAKRYIRSQRFVFDVVAVLPTDLVLVLDSRYSLVRANRLIKSYRVTDFIERTNIRTNYPNGFRIFNIVVVCMVIFHWNAALYFKISLMRGLEGTDFAAWEFNYVKNADPVFATCDIMLADADERCGYNETDDPTRNRMSYVEPMMHYWRDKIDVMHSSNFSKQYSLSFYWSSLTLTTSGQQPYPTEGMHNFLEIFDTIAGVLIFAVIVGSVGNVVVTMNRDRVEAQQLMDGIKLYMNFRRVTPDIQRRVIDCVSYIKNYGMIRDEQAIVETIPPRLQGELADCEPSLLYELVMRLQMHMYLPNDYLCYCGDVAKEMFIVKRGMLETLSETGMKLSVLREGQTFGEMSILKVSTTRRGNRRVRSLRSVGYADVYVLRREDVLEVLQDYPAERDKLVEKAKQMVRNRSQTADPESGNIDPTEAIIDAQTLDETISGLSNTVERIERDINALYEKFQTNSSTMKQRVTKLENIYTDKKDAIKHSYTRRNSRRRVH